MYFSALVFDPTCAIFFFHRVVIRGITLEAHWTEAPDSMSEHMLKSRTVRNGTICELSGTLSMHALSSEALFFSSVFLLLFNCSDLRNGSPVVFLKSLRVKLRWGGCTGRPPISKSWLTDDQLAWHRCLATREGFLHTKKIV
jgi:hypothetical protein